MLIKNEMSNPNFINQVLGFVRGRNVDQDCKKHKIEALLFLTDNRLSENLVI